MNPLEPAEGKTLRRMVSLLLCLWVPPVMVGCGPDEQQPPWSTGQLDGGAGGAEGGGGYLWPDLGPSWPDYGFGWPDLGAPWSDGSSAWPDLGPAPDAAPSSCNASSCPDGCCDSAGVCQPGDLDALCGAGGASCTECSSGEVCKSNGSCGQPGPVTYKVKLVSANLPASNTYCGLAELSLCDPFLVLTVGSKTAESSVKKDTAHPVWNEVLLSASSTTLTKSFHVELRDQDVLGSWSPIAKCDPHIYSSTLQSGSATTSCGKDVKLHWSFIAK